MDWQRGKIPYFCPPPGKTPEEMETDINKNEKVSIFFNSLVRIETNPILIFFLSLCKISN